MAVRSVKLQLLVTFLAVVTSGALVAGLLLSFGPWPTKHFLSAILDYDHEQIVRHLRWGADPNTSILRGRLLHYAVNKRDAEMVEMLISYGADVNRRSGWPRSSAHVSWTPLSFAEYLGYQDIAAILRRHGGEEYEGWMPMP